MPRIQARRWNLASLNEFREYFKLKPHDTFESINPDPVIAEQLKRLYGHPDNVELYPGVVVESAKVPMSPGSGLCASWTVSRAILADAVALVRGDRFFTIDYTPTSLTNWGFQAASYDLDIDGGSVIYKLVHNAFPHHIPQNSVYAHFPLVNPEANRHILMSLRQDHLYSYDRPNGPLPETTQEDTDPAAVALTVLNFGMHADHWEELVNTFYDKDLSARYQSRRYNIGGHEVIDIVETVNAAHAAFIESWFGVRVTQSDNGSIVCTLGSELQQLLAQSQSSVVSTSVQSITSWVTGSGPTAQEGRPGLEALQKLTTQSRDITFDASAGSSLIALSSLLYTILSCCTTATIEHSISGASHKSTQPVRFITIPATLRSDMYNVDLDTIYDDANLRDFKMDLEFAARVAKIVKDGALGKVLASMKNVKRMAGAQGQIKKVIGSAHGDVRYLNNIESDFLPYPVTMKVMW